MNLLKYIFSLLAVCMMFASCDKWLDVKPIDKISEDDFYSSEQGFQKALNGVYLALVNDNLYGRNLSCGMLDVLGQRYAVNNSEHKFYKLGLYQYKDDKAKVYLEGTWKQAYEMIANINLFLAHLSEKELLFKPADYKLYQGEAYALRALLHFDLFRLFGPVCEEATAMQEAIPYYDHYAIAPLPVLASGEVIEKLLADIDKAVELLKGDPITSAQGLSAGGGFWHYRNARINYYAALTLKARICLHIGRKTEAFNIASSLLDSKDPLTNEANNFMDIITPIDQSISNTDRVYLSEMIFYFQNLTRENMFKALFSSDLDDNNILAGHETFFTTLFDDPADIRADYWEKTSGRNSLVLFTKFSKYILPGNDKDPDRYKIQPILRLGELYLIAAESGDDTQKANYLEKLRLNRGHQVNNTVGKDLRQLVEDEYSREFYGEGQYFFYLKRNKVTSLKDQLGKNITMTDHYKIPLPECEINNRYE